MKALRWITLALGIATVVALVMDSGVHELVTVLARGGIKLLAIPAFMVLPLLLDAKGWQLLVNESPTLPSFVYSRWIGESVNSLLPVAQVGGLVVKAHLLRQRGVEPPLALASAIAAVTLSVATLLLFIMLGLALLAVCAPHDALLGPLAIAVAVLSLSVYVFYRIQRHGFTFCPTRLRARLASLAILQPWSDGGRELSTCLEDIYTSRRALMSSATLQFCGWMIGSGEIWLTVHLLGHRLSVTDAVMLESLGQAARNVGFFVPGGLGLQESAYLIVGPALGFTPELALAIPFVKRFRELALGIPGLVIWQLNEGWSGLRQIKRWGSLAGILSRGGPVSGEKT